MDWDDKEKALIELKKQPMAFLSVSERLRDDKDFVTNALSLTYRSNFRHVSPRLRDDKDILLLGITHNEKAFNFASDRLKADKEFIASCLPYSRYWISLESIHDSLKDDEELVSLFLDKSPNNFQYASPRLRDNPAIAFKAVTLLPNNIKYVSDSLKHNKKFALSVVGLNVDILRYLPTSLKDDRDIALRAVSHHGGSLAYVSARLKEDLGLVLCACKNNILASAAGSPRFKWFVFNYMYQPVTCFTPLTALIKHGGQ